MVTVGFCAILIGLGVDFAILVFGRYQQARDEGIDHPAAVSEAVQSLGKAIFFGALTTAVGFLGLAPGGLAGIHSARRPDRARHFLRRHFHDDGFFPFPAAEKSCLAQRLDVQAGEELRDAGPCAARPMLSISALLILSPLIIALSPKPPIIFDVSTHSMEPKRSDAGYALKTIMEKMPSRWEPVIGMVRAANAQQLHDYWKATAALGRAAARGQDQELFHSLRSRFRRDECERNRQKLAAIKFQCGPRRT